jgi:hypothetical protein
MARDVLVADALSGSARQTALLKAVGLSGKRNGSAGYQQTIRIAREHGMPAASVTLFVIKKGYSDEDQDALDRKVRRHLSAGQSPVLKSGEQGPKSGLSMPLLQESKSRLHAPTRRDQARDHWDNIARGILVPETREWFQKTAKRILKADALDAAERPANIVQALELNYPATPEEKRVAITLERRTRGVLSAPAMKRVLSLWGHEVKLSALRHIKKMQNAT